MGRLDFRNTNTLWASVLVETLSCLGLTTAVICPGSRSGPLAIAFAQHPQIEALPVLDERSAAFFALGVARRSGLPVVLVCTSGTAGANFYPAIIEAHHSRVPLLVLTADRPPELRHCHAGQAVDQLKLYGTYPNWQLEIALPASERRLLEYLRQTIIQAWERSLSPMPGPVHLNLPFREPLAPLPEPAVQRQELDFGVEDFFAVVQAWKRTELLADWADVPIQTWLNCDPSAPNRGLILAGPSQPADPAGYCQAIADLSSRLQWPVLADGLSPLRNYADLNPRLVGGYDLLLRSPDLAHQLLPQQVIQIGELPTSKELRTWLQNHPVPTWIIDPRITNFDPLHRPTTHLRCSVTTLASLVLAFPRRESTPISASYLKQWSEAEAQVQREIWHTLRQTTALFEGKAAWLLSHLLPPHTPLFVASSMPVRDLEWFWQAGTSRISPYFNRGTNGIDGTLSTALGISHHQPPSLLLTGDLALLHDTNGFLLRNHWQGHLTILLLNNNGGGIFGMLPIAEFDPPLEQFFSTPQGIDFAQLCATYQVEHELIQSWEHLSLRLKCLPDAGIRVLELPCDRRWDARWRKQHLSTLAENIRI
jgi:2-succinyl-5-enolpyruvyl-6-hydroxy-3-cyclohexene-1-carboxylate synthase